MDDSFCTYRHHRQKISMNSLQMKIRAAKRIRSISKGFGCLQQFTFVGEQGLDMLLGQLNRAHKRDPKTRHQFLLCVIADYTLFNGAASCVLLNGSALMLGQAKRPPLLLNGMQSGDGPFMLAVTFAYDKPTDEDPQSSVGRCNRLPVQRPRYQLPVGQSALL